MKPQTQGQVQIIPAKLVPASAAQAGNEVYISTTNESVGLHITHYKPTGGQIFSQTIPLSPSSQVEYILACDQNQVISTPNSYWAYNVSLALQCPTANAQDAVKGPYGRYWWRNNYWYFQPCSNTASLQDNGTVLPAFESPIYPLCLAPMNSTIPIYRTRINYGGQTFLDEMIFRESTIHQAQMGEYYQSMQKNTWWDQDISDVLNFEVLPFIYVQDQKANQSGGNSTVFKKLYCTITAFVKAIKATPALYLADGMEYDGTNEYLVYTIKPWFFVPLNVLNQILDIGNSFFISLLSGQQTILRIETNPYSIAQMFGNTNLFSNPNGFYGQTQTARTGIIDMDLVLVTKTSEVAVSDEASKENIIKFYPKYQWQTLPINNTSSNQSCQITTQHNSVQDLVLQLVIPDDAFSNYAVGTEYQFNDSVYVKQRNTLYNAAQLLGIEYGRINKCAGLIPKYDDARVVPDFAGGISICPNTDFVYFYKINFDRGNNSLRLFSDYFYIIDQMRQELLRSNNYLGQYVDTPPRTYNDITQLMTKYAFFITNFENFRMDIPIGRNCGMDGYCSKDGMILCNFQLGRFRDTTNIINFDPTYPGQTQSNKSYIYNNFFKVDSYQYYDEMLRISPKNPGNKIDQTEEIM